MCILLFRDDIIKKNVKFFKSNILFIINKFNKATFDIANHGRN